MARRKIHTQNNNNNRNVQRNTKHNTNRHTLELDIKKMETPKPKKEKTSIATRIYLKLATKKAKRIIKKTRKQIKEEKNQQKTKNKLVKAIMETTEVLEILENNKPITKEFLQKQNNEYLIQMLQDIITDIEKTI